MGKRPHLEFHVDPVPGHRAMGVVIIVFPRIRPDEVLKLRVTVARRPYSSRMTASETDALAQRPRCAYNMAARNHRELIQDLEVRKHWRP